MTAFILFLKFSKKKKKKLKLNAYFSPQISPTRNCIYCMVLKTGPDRPVQPGTGALSGPVL
jgi:hypothetical protein